jgi:hypothetical protein
MSAIAGCAGNQFAGMIRNVNCRTKALLIGGATLLGYLLPKEPRFGGKPLSRWTAEYQKTKSFRSQDAIRGIGTNGLPVLLEKLTNSQATVEERIAEVFNKQTPSRFGWVGVRTLEQRRALSGFAALGTNAVDAIPELIRMLEVEETANPATDALVRIGQPALGPLMEIVNGTNRTARLHALLGVLGLVTANPGLADDEILKLLLVLVDDADSTVRSRAVQMLALFPGHSHAIVEVLIDQLVRRKGRHSEEVVILRSFGADAEPALPFLRELLSPDATVQRMPSDVADAIKEIEKAVEQKRSLNNSHL